MKRLMLSLIVIILNAANPAASDERAIPDRFAKCSGFDAPENTAGVYFSTDCSTAFILPSRTGRLKTVSVLPSPNLDWCGPRNAQVRAAESEIERLFALVSEGEADEQDNSHCQLLLPRAVKYEDQIARIEAENIAQVSLISDLQDQRQRCVDAGLDCAGVYSELDRATRRQLSLEHRLSSTKRRLESFEERYSECFSQDEAVIETPENTSVFDEVNQVVDALTVSQSAFERIEGDTISVLLSLEHASLVREAQRRNSDFVVVAAPIEFGLTVDVDGNSTIEFSAVLDSSIPLMKAPASFFNQPGGDSPPDPNVFVFGPTAAGQVVMSLNGACTVRREGLDERFLAGYISANVVYRVPVLISLRLSAEADFVELYSRIARQTTRGGFFRTSSSSSVINSLRSDEVIKVTVQDDGLLSSEELFELTTTVKDRIIQRAIDQVAREYLPNAPTVNVSPPSETGADAASKGIRETCKAKWCQVAAVVLDVGSAIFGGTDATQEFVRSRDINVQDMTTVNSVYYTYGSIALVVE